MSNKPTLVSLARELGVSRQTVSNAINAPHRVKPVTLDRVRKAIEESGYRPHVAGRQLRTRRSRNIAMRLHSASDGINGSILDRFLHALTEAGQRHGYRLTLFTAPDDEQEIAAVDELLSTADVEGFVLTGTHHEDRRTAWLLDHEVPFVCFGRPWSTDADPFETQHSWVDVDGATGTAEATARLLERGHRRIGFLGWPVGSGVGDDRRAGWHQALQRAGADDEAHTFASSTEDSVTAGARAARELFDRGVTALVCASDSLALGAVATWRAVGLPDEGDGPPVIGFDDTPVAGALGLSSVHQPIEAVAEHVLTTLLRQLCGEDVPHSPPHHLLLPSALVVRTPDAYLLGGEPRGTEPSQ